MRRLEGMVLIVFFLSIIGLIMVLSASFAKALEKTGDGFFYFKKHALFVLMGFILMGVTSSINPRFYYRIAYLLLFLMIGLLVLVLVPGVGVEINGAVRWIKIGGWTFQPSEYLKIALVLFLARFFSTEQEGMKRILIPLLIYIPIGGLLLLEPDMGTAVFLCIVILTAYFLVKISLTQILMFLGILAFGMFGYFTVNKEAAERKKDRIIALINPDEHPQSKGYQVLQSVWAIGAGGITGVGLGKGKSKFHYLPEPFNDYIFSVIGEETGFIGLCILFFLFTALFLLGAKISLSANDPFITLSVFLLTFLLCFQAAIHMGVGLALLPPKGITLPFISYGGNSLLSSFITVGIILSMGRESER